jgi:hypothetical protein
MGPATQSANGLGRKWAWKATVGFVALALVGPGVDGCPCPARPATTALGCCRCCSRASRAATAPSVNVRSQSCGIPDSVTFLSEGFWNPDGPSAGVVADVAAPYDGTRSAPAAVLPEAPPFIPPPHPVLRI